MKKLLTLLLLCCLCIGSAWGEDVTTTYQFTSKNWEAIIDGDGANPVNWTSGKDGSQLTTGQGIQVTKTYSGANGTSPKSFTNVTKIVVKYCTNKSDGAGSIAVKVGNNDAVSKSVTKTGGTTLRELEYKYSTPLSGNVNITVTCTANSIYIYSVSITESTDPVSEKELIAIQATGTPAEFWKGDTFNHEGITVTALWDDETETDVTSSCTFSGYDMSVAGEQTVTATYQGETDTYEITVNTIANTQETAYTVAQAKELIDAGKDLATEVYVKGTVSKIVTAFDTYYGNISFNVSADGETTGDQFQFFRNFKGADKVKWASADETPQVGDAVIGYGTLAKHNSTYEFAEGNYIVSSTKVATLNIADITVANDEDITPVITTNVTGDYLIKYTSDNEDVVLADGDEMVTMGIGTATITATLVADGYKSAETTFTVTVTSAETLTGIAISGTLTKTEYTIGDTFDKAGLSATANYSDGTTADVTANSEWTISPETLTTAGENIEVSVTAKFNGKTSETSTFNVKVNKKAASIGIADMEVDAKQSAAISATTTPTDAALSYTITDGSEFITIEDGVITGVAEGTATVQASYAGNDEYAAANITFTVTVNPESADVVFVEYTDDLVEGDYIISYNDAAMNTTVSSSRLQYETVELENNEIRNPESSIVWHIAQSGDYWTIYNAAAQKYAASTGAKNAAQLLASGTDDKSLWTVTENEGKYDFVNKQNTSNSVNANLRRNGTYGFACYGTGTGGALTLYKMRAATMPFTVTFVDGENGSCETEQSTETGVGTGIILPTCSANNGYKFIGWANSENATNANAGQAGETYYPNTNCTLYAVYQTVYTLHITQPTDGGMLTVKNGDNTLNDDDLVAFGTNLTCEVTDIPQGKRFSRFYATWGEGQSKYKQTNPATFVSGNDGIPTEGFTDLTIAVSYQNLTNYTIALNVRGTVTNVPVMEDDVISTVLTEYVPTEAVDGYSFAGWATLENIDSHKFISESELVSGNMTLYAVYSKTEGGGVASDFSLDVTSGDFTISYDGYYASTSIGSISNGKISTTTDKSMARLYTFNKVRDGVYTIYDKQKGQYINYDTSTDLGYQDNAYNWTITSSETDNGCWRVLSGKTGRAFVCKTSSDGVLFGGYSTTNLGEDDAYHDIVIGDGSSSTTTYSLCTADYVRDGLSNGQLATICLPYASSSTEGATFYTIAGKRLDNEGKLVSVVFDEVEGQLEAGVPYVFKTNDDATSVTVVLTGKPVAEAGSANGLCGTFVNCPFTNIYEPGKLYVVTGNKIQAANANSGVSANRAYINMFDVPTYNQSTAVKGMLELDFDGIVDAINSINADKKQLDGAIYNLNGQRLNSLQKGLNIVNGKKVYIR